jgi:hypothetical protein
MIVEQIAAIERSPVVVEKRRVFRHPPFLLMAVPFFLCFGLGSAAQIILLMSAGRSGWDPGGTVFLVLLMIVCVLASGSLLWNLFGREVIAIDGRRVTFRKEVWGVGRSVALPADTINSIAMRPWSVSELRESLWGVGVGKVRLKVGKNEHTVGIGLTDAEAHLLAERLLIWKSGP